MHEEDLEERHYILGPGTDLASSSSLSSHELHSGWHVTLAFDLSSNYSVFIARCQTQSYYL